MVAGTEQMTGRTRRGRERRPLTPVVLSAISGCPRSAKACYGCFARNPPGFFITLVMPLLLLVILSIITPGSAGTAPGGAGLRAVPPSSRVVVTISRANQGRDGRPRAQDSRWGGERAASFAGETWDQASDRHDQGLNRTGVDSGEAGVQSDLGGPPGGSATIWVTSTLSGKGNAMLVRGRRRRSSNAVWGDL
jgi:hypothetical protein